MAKNVVPAARGAVSPENVPVSTNHNLDMCSGHVRAAAVSAFSVQPSSAQKGDDIPPCSYEVCLNTYGNMLLAKACCKGPPARKL